MSDNDLLPFYFGAQEIERRLGFSTGAARAELRKLCASFGHGRNLIRWLVGCLRAKGRQK